MFIVVATMVTKETVWGLVGIAFIVDSRRTRQKLSEDFAHDIKNLQLLEDMNCYIYFPNNHAL